MFCDKVDKSTLRWQAALAPFKGTSFIAVGGDLSYLASRFQLKQAECVGFDSQEGRAILTSARLSDLPDGARLILFEQLQDNRAEVKSLQQTDPRVLAVATLPGEAKGVHDYFDLFDSLVAEVSNALKGDDGRK